MGRKSWEKEKAMHRLWDLSMPILVNALISPKVKKSKKVEIALQLMMKMFPKETKIDLKTEATKLIVDLQNKGG